MKKLKQAGLSLVELIIGVALASVIIAGILQVFLSNREAFNLTESLVRIQENGRFAVNYIGEAIRQSGSYGCVPVASAAQQNIRLGASGVASTNAVQPATADGADGVNGVSFSDPDTLRLLQFTENTTTIDATVAWPANVAFMDPSSSNFAMNDLVLVSNCLVGDYLRAGPATTPTVLDTSNDPGFRQTQYLRLDETTTVNEVRMVTFSVNAADEELIVNVGVGGDQALIDGIENLQFTYGVDVDGDFNPDYFSDFSDIPANQVDQIMAIKVMVLAVSNVESAEDIVLEPQTITFNGEQVTMADRRLRKVFESIVTLRNQVN